MPNHSLNRKPGAFAIIEADSANKSRASGITGGFTLTANGHGVDRYGKHKSPAHLMLLLGS